MIGYVTVGADDIGRARRFYAAILPALGYGLEEGPEGLSYERPGEPLAPAFYVKPPFDGAPGFRAGYGARFYVGYLRDPQGNKIALYSDDPSEPGRDG